MCKMSWLAHVVLAAAGIVVVLRGVTASCTSIVHVTPPRIYVLPCLVCVRAKR